MTNGFVPWTKTRDPLACNTDDPINYIKVSRDPVRTPFQWNNEKNAGTNLIYEKCIVQNKRQDLNRSFGYS